MKFKWNLNRANFQIHLSSAAVMLASTGTARSVVSCWKLVSAAWGQSISLGGETVAASQFRWPVRGLSFGRPRFGEQLHGVTSAATLPPDSCKEEKKTPVPEEDRDALSSSASPRDVYDWKVKYHDLTSDIHQESVIEFFMKLYNSLEVYQPASPSFLSMLLPGPTSRRWGGSSR